MELTWRVVFVILWMMAFIPLSSIVLVVFLTVVVFPEFSFVNACAVALAWCALMAVEGWVLVWQVEKMWEEA